LSGVPAGSKDPSYRALGYGASVIGARAHGIILDDPLAQEAAQSENEQAKAKRYFDMTVDSRLHPDGWMLAIMTRWHENDLASHLSAKPDWTVLEMPAIGEYPWGPALWPERFSEEWLKAKRADIGGPLFNCLYQNDPTGMGGSVFREASWFRPLPPEYAQLRPRLNLVQFWDLAYSERATGDFTACVTVGIDPLTQRLFVPHVWRQRVGEAGLEEAMAEQIIASGARIIGVEEAAYRQRATQDLIARLNARLTARGYAATATAIKVTTDKVFRARLPAGRAEGGYLYVDRAAPWFPAFESECLGFPLAAHDDMVDALSGAVQLAIERGRPPSRQGQEMTFLGGSQPVQHDPRYPSQLVAQHMAGVAAGQD
ncbi:MAG TPA: phage terminase large subunit, partial [Chloroflexota bacterium]|nr:phage terminase large subunit [Chloroflexota bacterium]